MFDHYHSVIYFFPELIGCIMSKLRQVIQDYEIRNLRFYISPKNFEKSWSDIWPIFENLSFRRTHTIIFPHFKSAVEKFEITKDKYLVEVNDKKWTKYKALSNCSASDFGEMYFNILKEECKATISKSDLPAACVMKFKLEKNPYERSGVKLLYIPSAPQHQDFIFCPYCAPNFGWRRYTSIEDFIAHDHISTSKKKIAMAIPEDDPMTGTVFKTSLTAKEVTDFFSEWGNPKPAPFAQKLIEDSKLSIDMPKDDELEKQLLRLKDVIKGRWHKLLKKLKDSNYRWTQGPLKSKDPNDIFIDLLPDFLMLVKTEDIPTFGSQASTSSSKKSWIEESLPVSKMRKDFEGMVSKHQRRLTEEIYNAVDNAADDLNMETGDLYLYLAQKYSRLR